MAFLGRHYFIVSHCLLGLILFYFILSYQASPTFSRSACDTRSNAFPPMCLEASRIRVTRQTLYQTGCLSYTRLGFFSLGHNQPDTLFGSVWL